jgi:NitT/TauT family transport system permease protein
MSNPALTSKPDGSQQTVTESPALSGLKVATPPKPVRRRDPVIQIKSFYPVFAALALLLIWEICVRAFDVPELILPAPSRIFENLWVKRDLYFGFSIPTTLEIVEGFLVAAVAGILLGILVSFNSFANGTLYPLLISSQMVPKVAIAPVFIIWFGTGLEAKVFIAFLIAFFPIMISTMVGLQVVEADMVRLFRSMGASGATTFIKLRLPAALPNIFAGLKVGMSLAVVGAVVAEFVAADRGLGYYLLYANGQLDSPGVFGAILLLTAIGVVLYYLVEWSQRLFMPAALIKETDPTQATM